MVIIESIPCSWNLDKCIATMQIISQSQMFGVIRDGGPLVLQIEKQNERKDAARVSNACKSLPTPPTNVKPLELNLS